MKKITISAFFLFTIFSFGQEKEIKEAFASFEKGNKTQAQAILQPVETMIKAKPFTLEPNIYAKYLYIKGSTLLEQNKTFEASQYFAELSSYEQGLVYSLRNKSSKEKAFVLSKKEVEKLQEEGFSGLKETKSGTDYVTKVIPALDKKRQEVIQTANNDYNSKNYQKAASSFLEGYYLSKAVGLNEEDLKYYAALSYHSANDKEKAISLYTELLNDGYTGKRTIYTAVQNGQTVELTEQQYNTFKALSGSGFTNFKTEETPSVEDELYNYAVSLLISEKKYNDALEIVQDGLKKAPDNNSLNNQLGELYYLTGQTGKYVEKLKETVQKNPKDYRSLYNIGVLYSKDPKTYDLAKEYYNKAIEIDPDYSDAYLNMASLILSKDSELVEKINALGNTETDAKKYKYFTLLRKNMFKEALPYLEKSFEYNKKDTAIVKVLKETYKALKMEDKVKEMEQIEKSL